MRGYSAGSRCSPMSSITTTPPSRICAYKVRIQFDSLNLITFSALRAFTPTPIICCPYSRTNHLRPCYCGSMKSGQRSGAELIMAIIAFSVDVSSVGRPLTRQLRLSTGSPMISIRPELFTFNPAYYNITRHCSMRRLRKLGVNAPL